MQNTYIHPDYMLLVKNLANYYKNKFINNTDYNDLEQSGMVGLLDALSLIDKNKQESFRSFVYARICEEMQKELRNGDWTPPSYSKMYQNIIDTRENIERTKGIKATDLQVANEMNIPIEKYYKFIADYQISRMLNFKENQNFHETNQDDDLLQLNFTSSIYLSPADKCNLDDLRQRLAKEIDKLPERQKLVLSMYYDDELKMKTIGNILGVSESRVCQTHKTALAQLRKSFVN